MRQKDVNMSQGTIEISNLIRPLYITILYFSINQTFFFVEKKKTPQKIYLYYTSVKFNFSYIDSSCHFDQKSQWIQSSQK